MGIFLSAPPLCTASAGVSTAPSLQHYPQNNEDEDDEEEQEEDFYWEYLSQCLFRGQHQRVFPQRRVCNKEAVDEDDFNRA